MKRTRNGVNLLDILKCPVCGNEHIEYTDNILQCSKCGEKYGFKKNIPVVIDRKYSLDIAKSFDGKSTWEDYDHKNKTIKIARYSRNKKSIYQFITPSYRAQVGPTYKEFLENYNISGNVLELGGGPNSLSHIGVVNCDINSYSTVDIIGDARKLPFKDVSFEAIICNSVLEHIFEVDRVTDECHRILKDGGFIFMCVPQVCGRHHTIDYFRWTMPGLIKQFDQFDVVDKGVVLGPGMFVTHLVISMFISLTSFKFLNATVCFLLEWLLLPLRFVDLMGKGNPDHENYAHTIYIIGKK